MKRPPITQRALRHMRDASAFGWRAQSQIEDYAIAALESEGVDATTARNQVRRVWAEHFEITNAN